MEQCVSKLLSGIVAAGMFGILLAGHARAAEQPMQDCSGLPCVSLAVNDGATITVLIDTANSTSVLDLSTAKRLGLVLETAKDASGAPIPGLFAATLGNVRFGEETIGDVKVLVAGLDANIAKGTFPKADGTIDYVDLKNKLLTLDYRRHVVGLADAPATADCIGTCGAMSYPLFGKKGPPVVATTGFRVNGRDVAMQIDTFYLGSMLIYPPAVARLGLDTEAGSARVRHFPFVDGGVDMLEGAARSESFGNNVRMANAPLYFATPRIPLPDGTIDGMVGVALFADRVVHMDFRSRQFWIE